MSPDYSAGDKNALTLTLIQSCQGTIEGRNKTVKIGDLFELPENVIRIVGRRGKIKNSDETKIIAKYEVVKVDDEFKGKVIVTHGNKRNKEN